LIVAFDMFGTLADTSSVAAELAALCGGRAAEVAATWRARQLEYMFRVTAMGQFPSFAELTRWSLTSALAQAGFPPTESQLDDLAGAYRRLRPFDDARPALAAVRRQGHQVAVLSVGPRAWLEELSVTYGDHVDAIVSAEDAGVFKPHPGIYRYLLSRTRSEASDVLLVSGNPFDIIGASAVGLRTAWCKRDPSALFDPWGPRPDYVIAGLAELAAVLAELAAVLAPDSPDSPDC